MTATAGASLSATYWSRSLPTLTGARDQGRAGQGRAGQGRAGQVRSGQVRSGQVRSGQGRAGQGILLGQDLGPTRSHNPGVKPARTRPLSQSNAQPEVRTGQVRPSHATQWLNVGPSLNGTLSDLHHITGCQMLQRTGSIGGAPHWNPLIDVHELLRCLPETSMNIFCRSFVRL